MYMARGFAGYDALNLFDWSYLSSTWCAKTGLCSDAMVKASLAYQNPTLAYPAPPAPPAVRPPADIINPPADETAARAAVNAVIQRQSEEQKAANQQFFSNVADENAGGDNPPVECSLIGLKCSTLAIVGLSVFGAVLLIGRSR